MLGRPFTICNDQRSLKYQMEQGVLGEDQQKWVVKLLRYDFKIQYRLSHENQIIDVLSKQSEI